MISGGKNKPQNSELSGLDYNFHENTKEFNRLKEILRDYKPNKNMARANTIKRRKNKKALLEKIKSQILLKFEKTTSEKRPTSSSQPRRSKQIQPTKRTSSTNTNFNRMHHHHHTDINIQQIFSKDASQRQEKISEYSQREVEKSPIELEEDVIYFRYNSDGEAQYDDLKSELNSVILVHKQSTLKKMKTSLHGDSISGSNQKDNNNNNTRDKSAMQDQTDNVNNSVGSSKSGRKNSNSKFESLVASPQFQSYHQLIQKNPNANFRLENSKQILSPGLKSHRNSLDAATMGPSYGRFLTVKPSGTNQIIKMNTVNEENEESLDLQSSQNNSIIILRPIGNRTKTNDQAKFSGYSNDTRNQSKRYIKAIQAIEEEMSEHSSPALHQRGFSFKRLNYPNENQQQIASGDNSVNMTKQTSDLMIENGGDITGKAASEKEEVHEIRKFTSLLTLNRYNKIYTEEFREEDIEVMNINSTVKRLNETLKNISVLQVILFLIGWVIFVIDSLSSTSKKQGYHAFESSILLTVIQIFNDSYPILASICNRFELPMFIFEIMLMCIHLPPFVDQFKEVNTRFYFIQSMIALFLMLKTYTVIRYIAFQSPLNSSKGRFIVALRGIDYTNAFLVKVWITMNPLKGLVIGITFLILINSYILMLNERVSVIDEIPCYGLDRKGGSTILKYRDSIWLTMITFMTVGYGDFYPTTNGGRYIEIITVICGQLYSAIVIGLVHGQLQLTSEECGVLNIISNNKKEKRKKVLATTLIYYMLKMAGHRNKLLQKGEIHWYKTREVQNIRFELYVHVMQFKKVKHDLQAYYASRSNDNNLNIIRNTETQLALLATEVIRIFDQIKDPKLERKKNFNDSYLKRKSILNHILEQEASKGKKTSQFANHIQRIQSDKNCKSSKLLGQKGNQSERNDNENTKIRTSLTMTPQLTSFLQKPSLLKNNNSRIEEEEKSSYGSEFSEEKSNVLVKKYATNLYQGEQVSLARSLSIRKKQQNLQQQLTKFTNNSSITPLSSKQAISWRNITGSDALKKLSCEDYDHKNYSMNLLSKPENSIGEVNDKPEKRLCNSVTYYPNYDYFNSQVEKFSHKEEQEKSPPVKLPYIQESVKVVDESTSPLSEALLLDQRHSTQVIRKSKTLNRFKSHDNPTGVKKRHSTMRTTPKNSKKGSGYLAKSNTQVKITRENSLKSSHSSNKFKAQKTQLHPTLVSIIEEEETFSDEDDNEDFQYDADDQMDQIPEETSLEQESISDDEECNSKSDDEVEEEEVEEEEEEEEEEDKQEEDKKEEDEINKEQIKTILHKENSSEDYDLKLLELRNQQPLSNNDFLRQQTSSNMSQPSLGQALNELCIRRSLNDSLQILNKIYENVHINKRPKIMQTKKDFMTSSQEDINFEESPGYSQHENQSIISTYSQMRKGYKNHSSCSKSNEFGLQISEEDMISLSQKSKSSRSPNKQEGAGTIDGRDQNLSQPHHLQMSTGQRLTPKGEKQKQIQHLETLIVKNPNQESEIILSPIFPLRKKETQITPFSLQLKQLRSESSGDLQSIVSAKYKSQQTEKESYSKMQPQIDLIEIIERFSNSPSLSINQKQSILSFQEQINNILQVKDNAYVDEKLPSDFILSGNSQSINQKLSSSPGKDSLKAEAKKSEKELLKEEVKQEEQELTKLCSRIQETDSIVSRAIAEAKLKIQKLKNSQIHPTLQVNVINNVNNIHNINTTNNNSNNV